MCTSTAQCALCAQNFADLDQLIDMVENKKIGPLGPIFNQLHAMDW